MVLRNLVLAVLGMAIFSGCGNAINSSNKSNLNNQVSIQIIQNKDGYEVAKVYSESDHLQESQEIQNLKKQIEILKKEKKPKEKIVKVVDNSEIERLKKELAELKNGKTKKSSVKQNLFHYSKIGKRGKRKRVRNNWHLAINII